MNVDEFVAIKVLPEYRELANHLQKTTRDLVPQIDEVFSYGIPAYRAKHIIAVIRVYLDIAMEFDNK